MTAGAPTRVLLFAYAASTEDPVAEFRWSPDADVTLTVLNPAWSRLAEEYFARGVPLTTEQRVVPASDGPAFMRALLQPANMTYYGFVDASPESAPGTAAPEEPDGGGYSVEDAYRILAGMPPLSKPGRGGSGKGRYAYCKVFVRTDATAGAVLETLARLLPGGVVIDVRRNAATEGDPGDDFVRWPVTIDVDAEEADHATVVDTVARILTALWETGQPAVAACDYEDELPWAGGIGRLRDSSG